MRYSPCWLRIGISKDRYFELLHFCRQYPEWKIEAESLVGVRVMKMDGQPHGTAVIDPVASAAEKREKLLKKMAIVEDCARTVGDGQWYSALIQHVCVGKAFSKLDVTLMPATKPNTFFKHRSEFFSMLDKKLSENEN